MPARLDRAVPADRYPRGGTTGRAACSPAALIKGLDQYQGPESAARLAVAAAGLTVGHPGGRPELTWPGLDDQFPRVGRAAGW